MCVQIPEEYKDFIDVFSQTKASSLPPHRSYDCAIDLLPSTTPPHGCIYPLTLTEQAAMEMYVREALHQGYIEPSTSPALARYFFVEMKGGGLQPCIDYRGLKCIMIKEPYPFLLVPATLEHLREARIFTKLDLRRSASENFLEVHHNQRRYSNEHSKWEAVREWPKPHTMKELQTFWGFANFYSCFL